jgi:transposase
VPAYGPQAARPRQLESYEDYLRARFESHPGLSAMRLLREIRAMDYQGSRTAVTDYVRQVRPVLERGYEHRFETAPGQQGQADFAHFTVIFSREPQQIRVVWLFTLVLGFSRYLFGRFVARQTLSELVRCHLRAPAGFGSVPQEMLYDRMKAVVLGEDADGALIYHPLMRDLGSHHGFVPGEDQGQGGTPLPLCV